MALATINNLEEELKCFSLLENSGVFVVENYIFF